MDEPQVSGKMEEAHFYNRYCEAVKKNAALSATNKELSKENDALKQKIELNNNVTSSEQQNEIRTLTEKNRTLEAVLKVSQLPSVEFQQDLLDVCQMRQLREEKVLLCQELERQKDEMKKLRQSYAINKEKVTKLQEQLTAEEFIRKNAEKSCRDYRLRCSQFQTEIKDYKNWPDERRELKKQVENFATANVEMMTLMEKQTKACDEIEDRLTESTKSLEQQQLELDTAKKTICTKDQEILRLKNAEEDNSKRLELVMCMQSSLKAQLEMHDAETSHTDDVSQLNASLTLELDEARRESEKLQKDKKRVMEFHQAEVKRLREEIVEKTKLLKTAQNTVNVRSEQSKIMRIRIQDLELKLNEATNYSELCKSDLEKAKSDLALAKAADTISRTELEQVQKNFAQTTQDLTNAQNIIMIKDNKLKQDLAVIEKMRSEKDKVQFYLTKEEKSGIFKDRLITNLQAERTANEQKIKDLENFVKEYKEKTCQHNKQIEESALKMQAMESALVRKSQELKEANGSKADLQKQIKTLATSRDQQRESYQKKLQDARSDTKAEFQENELRLQACRVQITDKDRQIQTLEEQLQMYMEKAKDYREAVDSNAEEYQRKLSECQETAQQLRECDADKDLLQAEINSVCEYVKSAVSEIKSGELFDARDPPLSLLKIVIPFYTNKCLDLGQQIDQLSTNLRASENNNVELKAELHSLKKQLTRSVVTDLTGHDRVQCSEKLKALQRRLDAALLEKDIHLDNYGTVEKRCSKLERKYTEIVARCQCNCKMISADSK